MKKFSRIWFLSFASNSPGDVALLTVSLSIRSRRIFLTHTENSMAVLPSSICKLKKARGGGGGGLFRTGSNGSRKGNHSNSGDGEDEDDPYRSEMEDSDNTESPPEPLPLYQQRENYFT